MSAGVRTETRDGAWGRYSVRVNEYGFTFEEWEVVARGGEEAKVRPHVEERLRVREAAFALGGSEAVVALRQHADPYHGLRLSRARARAAWAAGEDPCDYAAAPRPLPRAPRRKEASP